MITDETFHAVENRLGLDFSLKRQQRDAIRQLCGGVNNVFAFFWPTGFGNSALFMITPLLVDEIE